MNEEEIPEHYRKQFGRNLNPSFPVTNSWNSEWGSQSPAIWNPDQTENTSVKIITKPKRKPQFDSLDLALSKKGRIFEIYHNGDTTNQYLVNSKNGVLIVKRNDWQAYEKLSEKQRISLSKYQYLTVDAKLTLQLEVK